MISNVRGRGVLTALVLALAVGNAGGIPRARAAPDSAETISWSVFANPQTFEIRNCPKAKQEIYVGLSRTVTKVISGKPYESSSSVNGFDIQVKTKPSNGSISPSAASIISMDRTGTFQTVFIYDPEKAGKDTITFSSTGSQPDELLAPLVPSADATVQVKVLPCKYRASLIYRSELLATGGYVGDWIEYGSMQETLLEPDQNGHFEAAGLSQLDGFQTDVPACPFTYTGSDLQVDIAGDVGQDLVNLTFDFGFPEVTFSYCSGSYTSPTYSFLGQENTAIPTAGGVTNIVSPRPTGSTVVITVIVLPEAEQPSVSRTDRPVTWLPD
jgi:hypothetical protein